MKIPKKVYLVAAIAAAQVLPATAVAENRGHVTISYQQIRAEGFESTVGDLDIGKIDTQTLNFEVAYHVGERVTLHAAIPLVRKRYRGTFPHLPDTIVPAKSDRFVDDGDYHTDFQDFMLGVSYAWKNSGALQVEPFLNYGLPSHDYPHFGHAAVGQNLWRVELGSRFTYRHGLSDIYYRLDPSYVFVEKTLGVDISHWRLQAEVGYRFQNGIVGRFFVQAKEGGGLDFPDDLPPPRNTELWFQHDRLVKHNYVNAGIGVDFRLGGKNHVSTSLFTMVREEQVHIMDYAFNVGVTRYF